MILVGIPCFNRAQFTERTVRALARFEPRSSYTLACVNDASTDCTADVLYSLQCERLVDYVIDHRERKGVAASMNDAWRLGEDDATAFVKLDNDVELIRPGLFDRLAATLAAFGSNVGMAAPQVIPGTLGRKVVAGAFYARRPPGNLNGALLYVSRAAFDRVGYFHEWDHPYGFSDAEYCFRCRRAGLDHLYLPEPPGHWCDHLDDGDRKYLSWKVRMRGRYRDRWAKFSHGVRAGRIPIRQPFRITGER